MKGESMAREWMCNYASANEAVERAAGMNQLAESGNGIQGCSFYTYTIGPGRDVQTTDHVGLYRERQENCQYCKQPVIDHKGEPTKESPCGY